MLRLPLLRKLMVVAAWLLAASPSVAQILQPVKWTFSTEVISESEVNLVFKADIDKSWHLYAQDVPKGGPLPTVFIYDASDGFQRIGKALETPKSKVEYDATFEMNVGSWEKQVSFRQKIKVTSVKDFKIAGRIEYMVCNEGSCIPLEDDFSFNIKGNPKGGEVAQPNPQPEPEPEQPVTELDTLSADTTKAVVQEFSATEETTEERTLWWIFIAGFLGGLIALLTPCVWPMIPMTVSFFLKRSKKRSKAIADALIYGLAIIVIYVSLGLGVTLIFGADALNALSTSAFFNLLFFLLLVVFAIAFFGAFELTLPSKWTNAMDRKADTTSGLLSIFFMAFTLALVSFSCTGPIIGTLLVEAVTQGVLAPTIGMIGFATALAIPFALFAIFPSWLNSMPKSGGWMNSVKVTLGFLELALALKFLSNADLAYHWGILDREVFIVLWIAIFALMGAYYMGWFRLKHDDETKHVSVPKLFLAIISFSFAVYMVPGLWGAPLKAISAFTPPIFTQDFNLNENVVHAKFDDYDLGMEAARRSGKPVIVDYTGWGCVNCREMEAAVWTDSRVAKLLLEDYVLVSLYVDDKRELPENEQIEVDFGGKTRKLRTVGNKWSHHQASLFETNSQPYYVLLDNDGKLLAKPRAYNKDVKAYIEWLEAGLKEYKLRKK